MFLVYAGLNSSWSPLGPFPRSSVSVAAPLRTWLEASAVGAATGRVGRLFFVQKRYSRFFVELLI